MSESDKLLRTIEAVHAAGLDPDRWPDALAAVARIFGAVGASLENYDFHAWELIDFKVVGIPPAAETRYVEYFARHNSRAAYAVRHPSEKILWDYRVLDESAMAQDPYYMDYLRPIGLRYFMTGQIVSAPQGHGIVSIQRSRKQGHIGKTDIERMRILLPHLRLAYDVSTRLKRAEFAARAHERALDWIADGAALVRRDGRILYSNQTLTALATETDGFRITRGRFIFPIAETSRRFEAAVASANGLHDGEPRLAEAMDFPAPRPSGAPPYIISVRPLLRAGQERRGDLHATAIVFVRDPLRSNAPAVHLLREMFGLTEAEAGVARALQAGVPLVDYAREHGISLNTVYTQLRKIKEKTHTRRQAELIRKLNDIQLPLLVR